MNRITSRWLNLKGIHWLFRIKLLIFVTLSALYLKTNSLELQHPQEHSKVLNHEDMCYSVLFCVFSLVHMAGCATWPPCAAISGFSQRLCNVTVRVQNWVHVSSCGNWEPEKGIKASSLRGSADLQDTSFGWGVGGRHKVSHSLMSGRSCSN